MTEEQMKDQIKKNAADKTANLLKQAKEGAAMLDNMTAEEEEAERKRREAEDAGPAPVIELAVDTTIYCPPVMTCGLKWSSDKVVDLDISALVLNKDGYVVDVGYYNSDPAEGGEKGARITGDKAIKLSGDDRMGSKKDSGDNENLVIDFNKLAPAARYIGVCVTCYSDGYTFSDCSTPTVELRDGSKVLFSTTCAESAAKAIDGKSKHSGYIAVMLLKSGDKWVAQPEEKLFQAQRWLEALQPVQKLLLDQKLIPPIDGERPFPKAFRQIKGEEIVITSNISKLLCGLSWVGNVDLDLAVLLFRYKEFIDHIDPVRHKQSKDGAVFHRGDSKVGKGKDDEKIYVDLSGVSRKINEMFFLVTVFVEGMQGGFSAVKDAHVRLVDATNLKEVDDPEKELTRFVLSTTCGTRSAQIMCKLWRVGPSKWHVIAMGEPSSGLFYLHLIPKVTPFLDEAPAMRTYLITIHSGKNLPADLLPYFRVRFDRDSAKSKQIKKATSTYKEEIMVSGQATAMDVGIFHKSMGHDKFYGQIFVPVDNDFKKKSFKLEDRGKKKEKITSGGELCISLENITGTPAALAAETKQKDKAKKEKEGGKVDDE